MSDQRTTDDSFTSVRARRGAIVDELSNLRFIGEATAGTLASAEITAEDIRKQTVTYLQLIELGVDPGVAAKIRREHSLSWSDEPAVGARLRRRAQQIRHLRDDERSWINASGGSTDAISIPTSTDGSGSSTEAELAWQARSRADVSVGKSSRSESPPLDPAEYTVPELEESLQAIDDPEVVTTVLRAERTGDARATALEAIEHRLDALGADADDDSDSDLGQWEFPADEHAPRADSMGVTENQFQSVARGIRGVMDVPIRAVVVTGLKTRLTHYRVAVSRPFNDLARFVDRFETRVRTTTAEDWRKLSLGLLLGLVTLGSLGIIGASLGSPSGPELTVLSLILVTVVVGMIALPLHWWRAVGGSEMAMLAALVGLGSVGLIAAIGSVTSSVVTTPVTLAVFALVAASLLTTTFFSEPM